MDYFYSKNIQLVAEHFYDKYSNALNINSDIETFKKEYVKDVKNNIEENSENYKVDKIELENRLEECVIYYQNLLNEKFLAL